MVEWAVYQLMSYSLLDWLILGGIAFLAAYLGGWVGIFLGHFLVAFVVLLLDIDYAMSHAYMDMDIVFTMGVSVRMVLINTFLLPVNVLGLLAQALSVKAGLLAFNAVKRRRLGKRTPGDGTD
jgi:hypothetical protein